MWERCSVLAGHWSRRRIRSTVEISPIRADSGRETTRTTQGFMLAAMRLRKGLLVLAGAGPGIRVSGGMEQDSKRSKSAEVDTYLGDLAESRQVF